jgi:hypothetical protein
MLGARVLWPVNSGRTIDYDFESRVGKVHRGRSHRSGLHVLGTGHHAEATDDLLFSTIGLPIFPLLFQVFLIVLDDLLHAIWVNGLRTVIWLAVEGITIVRLPEILLLRVEMEVDKLLPWDLGPQRGPHWMLSFRSWREHRRCFIQSPMSVYWIHQDTLPWLVVIFRFTAQGGPRFPLESYWFSLARLDCYLLLWLFLI